MFEIRAATFEVHGRQLLGATDLTLKGGRVHGLIGHNGSGKSTLLKLLARQQPASRGELYFASRPLSRWGHREFARRVAYLPQQVPATENLLGRELSQRLGLGVIIVLHDVNMAARYCDHLVALHGGRVLTQGSPDELMNEATLEAIYGIPMRVMPHPVGHHSVALVHA
ncbi:ATP-binding cassette domain-containing protein [Halomonas sp. Y3]|uniref:ATP-binding cassette domain-containing protein n=1 Tax=Halomonas sp. Y3 TaxID=2956797 RepID=UPI00209CDB70|nr:ATP-binding cassette domain-containing protein [Halomonas sp. Y3]